MSELGVEAGMRPLGFKATGMGANLVLRLV